MKINFHLTGRRAKSDHAKFSPILFFERCDSEIAARAAYPSEINTRGLLPQRSNAAQAKRGFESISRRSTTARPTETDVDREMTDRQTFGTRSVSVEGIEHASEKRIKHIDRHTRAADLFRRSRSVGEAFFELKWTQVAAGTSRS